MTTEKLMYLYHVQQLMNEILRTGCYADVTLVSDDWMTHLEWLVTSHNGLVGVWPALRGEVDTTKSREDMSNI